jgi:hypothetical protein
VDIDNRVMSFSLNGSFEAPMGVAFSEFVFSRGLFPAATFSAGQTATFNFGGPPGTPRQLVRVPSPPSLPATPPPLPDPSL